MISEIVLFDLRPGTTREQAHADLKRSIDRWRREPGLLRKTFLYDPVAGQMGGAYLWRDKLDALRAHDAAWRARIAELHGSEPVIRYFETPVVVDNVLDEVIEETSHEAARSEGPQP
jgi:hypothetical protein